MYIPDFLVGYVVGAAVECITVIITFTALENKRGKQKGSEAT